MEDLIDIKSVYRSTVGLFIARLLQYVRKYELKRI